MRLEVEYDASTYDTILRWTMPDLIPGRLYRTPAGVMMFSRISGTGHAVCHPVGEPDMQSSCAFEPSQLEPLRRFEDLMDGQGRIRLRTKLPVMDRVRLFEKCLHAVQRGWVLFHGQISDITELHFRPVPEGVDEHGRMFVLDGGSGSWRAYQRYAEADFDAMIAVLEPYELVRDDADTPLTVPR